MSYAKTKLVTIIITVSLWPTESHERTAILSGVSGLQLSSSSTALRDSAVIRRTISTSLRNGAVGESLHDHRIHLVLLFIARSGLASAEVNMRTLTQYYKLPSDCRRHPLLVVWSSHPAFEQPFGMYYHLSLKRERPIEQRIFPSWQI